MTQAQQPYPANVSFYSHMGIEAARRAYDEDTAGTGGAFRLWVLAKALDVQGLGMVRRRDLREYVLSLGATPQMWQRWIIQARAHGFIVDIQKGRGKRRDWWLILPRAGKVALQAGWAANLGKRVTIPAGDLIGPGWKARIFAAWEDSKQISRETIQKKFNVPVRTQTYRAAQLGDEYTTRSNYSKSDMKAGKLWALTCEHSNRKAAFLSVTGFVYWRLPDMRFFSHVLRKSKGRARKENKFIRSNTENLKGLSYVRQALTEDFRPGEWVRLFNASQDQLEQAMSRIETQDKRIDDLYLYSHESGTGAGIWKHKPVGMSYE